MDRVHIVSVRIQFSIKIYGFHFNFCSCVSEKIKVFYQIYNSLKFQIGKYYNLVRIDRPVRLSGLRNPNPNFFIKNCVVLLIILCYVNEMITYLH